tara:strand:- start:107 stop:1627 length:1521 start_codon:yes stop_codon:yes gene_type:complete
MLSRILGFLRDILIASVLGASSIADCFFVAFRFPNLFRRLFAEGAFSAAFVPMFSAALEKHGRHSAKTFADGAFSILLVSLIIFIGVVELFMPLVMWVLAPGFDAIPGKMALATELSRIAFPYLIFISLVSLQSGVLNSLNRFAAAAATPILLNLTLITALLGFAKSQILAGYALSWGIFAAGVLQFAWLRYHCKREGLPVSWRRPELTPEIQLLGRRILPVIFGASLYQINLLIGTILASLISDGAVSFLYYADRVTQLPLGVVGIAVSTALLPTLSQQLAAGNETAAMRSQNRGLEYALLLTLPATVALYIISEPLITVLFERGAFSSTDSIATAWALMAYSTGLPAYVLIRVLTPGFFAREDTSTPVKIAAVAMIANIVLNLFLMQIWGHIGIAIAASISAWINATALGWILHRRKQFVLDKRLSNRWPRIVLASLLMGIILYFAGELLAPWFKNDEFYRSAALLVLVCFGIAFYGLIAQILGAAHWRDLKYLFRKSSEVTNP